MSSATRTSIAARENALAGLGLPADATPDQITAARAALTAFLDGAPPQLREWAAHQHADVEAAYAVAAGREQTPVDGDAAVAAELGEDVGATTPPAKTWTRPVTAGAPQHRSPLRWLALLAVCAAAVALVYSMGDQPTSGAASGSAPSASATTPTLDRAAVTALEAKVAADPKDVASMRELGRLYYEARQYAEAGAWQEKILAVVPKDVDAHLALGVTQLSRGQADDAVANWKKAADLDPGKAEPHYNLGFYYLSKGDMTAVRTEWDQVVAIAPDSDMAANVKSHLSRLSTATASPTGSATSGSTGN